MHAVLLPYASPICSTLLSNPSAHPFSPPFCSPCTNSESNSDPKFILAYLQAQATVSYLTLALLIMKGKVNDKYYWVLVWRRDASTNWNWVKRWIMKSRPKTFKRWVSKQVDKSSRPIYSRYDWVRMTKLDTYIHDFWGQSPQHYFHPFAIPAMPSHNLHGAQNFSGTCLHPM